MHICKLLTSYHDFYFLPYIIPPLLAVIKLQKLGVLCKKIHDLGYVKKSPWGFMSSKAIAGVQIQISDDLTKYFYDLLQSESP